ncbi:hypothetical protein KP509_20G053700 [Ceratopteris richardii]|uniref:Uncharacterized protein n=1 Tax=Ceratopteris richardii TaxID=49495 RepID=A0A8T2SIJ5_CERRI|nr:hypothetical protein KP509_20G053700 [Ceratopteris richardii]
MACKFQVQEVTHALLVEEITGFVEDIVAEESMLRNLPPPPPVNMATLINRGAEHPQAMIYQAEHVTVINNYVLNVSVNPIVVPSASTAAQPRASLQAIEDNPVQESSPPFQANPPSFHRATMAQGVDFGHNFAQHWYRAEKHSDVNHQMINYSQCKSKAQDISRTASLGLSQKRVKHVILLFDCEEYFNLAHQDWPENIHLSEIQDLIRKFGEGDCCRDKVSSEIGSVYLFLLKKVGQPLTVPRLHAWCHLVATCRSEALSASAKHPSGRAFLDTILKTLAGIVNPIGLVTM